MRASVIMTTYNQPVWLAKVIRGFARQTLPPSELIVADDGSGPETAAALESCARECGLPLVHLRQSDAGFRKCQALNHGIRIAQGDYLIFTDADCVPHRDFVAWHCRLARPGRFLSGGYVKLGMATSTALAQTDIDAGHHCDPSWLAQRGDPAGRDRKLRCAGARTARVWDLLTTTRASWNGHNASTWRRYALAANGFDHAMQYGGQDREFGERLVNAGIRGLQIRHHAVCVHLDHKRGYATPESIARNRTIRAETRRSGRTRTAEGMEQLDLQDVTVRRLEPSCV
ncbi:MAG: glycosyltransferase family 2 protein [Planctomycetota bacterium]